MAGLQLLCAALLLVSVHCEDITEEEGVLVLTDANFDDALAEHQNILVEFYAPWCGHCKSLAPEYAKAAQQLKADGSEVRLGKVDATEQTKISDRFQIQGYPTLKFFKSGKAGEFNGGRTAAEIVSWLSKKTGPAAMELTSADQAKSFVEGRDVVVVGFFASKDSDNAKAFLEAAAGIDDVQFGVVTEQSLAEEYEATLDSIVLLKTFDEKRNVFDGEYTAEAIAEFVKANQLPLVTEFTDETAPKIFGGDVKVHLLYFEGKSSDTYEEHVGYLSNVAADFKGKVLFVTINADIDDNERIMEFFNVKKATTPAFRIVKLSDEDMKKFAPESDEITEENMRKFVSDYLSGNLKPHFASEDVPEDWDAKAVKILVGKNFQEVVLDSENAVFVEFYAPWCGHCKQLSPIWDQLGEHYASKDVIVAKMDSTVNEIDVVSVQSFPTIYYFPKGAKDAPVEFKGSRTLDGFMKFLDSDGKEGGEDEGGEEPAGDDEELPQEEDLEGMEGLEGMDEGLEGADEGLEGGEDGGEDDFDEDEQNTRDEL